MEGRSRGMEQCDPWLVCAPGSDMNVALSPHRTQEGGQSCQRTIPGAECPGPWLMSQAFPSGMLLQPCGFPAIDDNVTRMAGMMGMVHMC